MTSGNQPEYPPDIGRYNDEIASRYDMATQAGGWQVNEWVASSLDAEQCARIGSVLDLGAGTGQTVAAVIDTVGPSQIVAVDASAQMLEHLRTKLPVAQIQGVNALIEAYLAEPPDETAKKFDLITAIGSFEFVKNLPDVLGRAADRLNPQGNLLFTYIPQTDPGLTERTFQVPNFQTAFTEYYWPSEDIENRLVLHGLGIYRSAAFPAYTRGSETVNYHFIASERRA